MSAVFSFAGNYANVSACFNLGMLECFCFYIFQLAIVYSVFICFAVCHAADFTGIVDTNNTIDCGAAIHHKYRCALAINDGCSTCCTIQCQLSIAVGNGGNISQIACNINLVIGLAVFNCSFNCCILAIRQCSMFACFCFYIFQLAYVYCVSICSTFCNVGDLLAVCVQAVACNICLVAITNASIRHIELSCLYAVYSQVFLQGQTICSNIKVVFTFLKFYRNCIIFSTNGNTIACCISGVFCIDGVNVLSICSCSLIYRCDIGTCFYLCLSSFQLCNVYSVGICSTCCNVGDLASCAVTAHRYSTFSSLPGCIRLTVSTIAKHACSCACYAAGTQSNTAFTGNFGIMTENNSVINSCFGYFISRAENNVILTAYLVIITDNLIAVCGNFIFNTDYSNIRCIFNSILITVNQIILCTSFRSTGYFILYAGKLGIGSVISLVAAADCQYRAARILVGLHSFNSVFLSFGNRH